MEGPLWPKPIRDNWMTYYSDECYWFSAGFGVFNENGKCEEDAWLDVDSCNDNHDRGMDNPSLVSWS